jgi:intraflagellar transport protein 122
MYTALKKFNDANQVITNVAKKKGGNTDDLLPTELIEIQAKHEFREGNLKAAADLYVQAKKYKEAIEIFGNSGNLDSLMDICKNLEKKTHTEEIELCAKFFRQKGHHTFAKQAYLKLGSVKQLMALHVELHKWDEAFMLAKQNPKLSELIYLPYADWLSS